MNLFSNIIRKPKVIRAGVIYFILACLLFSSVFASGVYRWTDEHGNVQFGDNPGQTKSAKSVKMPVFKEADPAYLNHLKQQKKYLNARQEERQKNGEKKEKENSLKEAMALKCKAAQDRLKMFTENARIYVKEGGERRYLNGNEQDAEKQKSNDEILTYCR